jgi:bacterial/archaeal transporter family protein
MDRWVWFAVASMVFAGCTSVLAKHGLAGISGELGLAVRTLFVCAFVFAFALVAVPAGEVGTLTRANVTWLALSALTTAASWVFYYKALKDGDVSSVALIDKGSFVVAVVLAWLFLGEKLTPRVLLGGALILCGVLVVARK